MEHGPVLRPGAAGRRVRRRRRPRLGARAARAACCRAPARRLQAPLLLAMHGYAARQAKAGRALVRRQRTLENMGVRAMRVLVTGHRGYIGTVLVCLLREAGHDVVGLDSMLYERCTFGSDADDGVDSLRADIRELRPGDLAGIDAVAHLAGVCNDPLGDLLPETTAEINHRATLGLARIAKDAGVHRFVFSSTCSVYGAAAGGWVTRNPPPHPPPPY